MSGSTSGSYRIEERIGRSDTGVVFRAIDTEPVRSVAIKVLLFRNPPVTPHLLMAFDWRQSIQQMRAEGR